MDPMMDTPNPGAEQQLLATQALLLDMQRQLQELQAAAALHAASSPPPPVTPPAPGHAPPNPVTSQASHLKPNRPIRYSGIKDYTTIENWIASVNSYFALTRAQPPNVYHYLNTIFTDEAAIWFRYHYGEDQAATLTWEEVRTALRTFFTPPNKDRRLQDEWAQLRQTTTVAEYVGRFYKLGMQLPHMEPEHLLDKFLRGLKPKTRMELELKDPQTLNEAIRLADRFDSIVYRKTVPLTPSTPSHSHSNEYESGGEPMQIDAMRTKSKTPPTTQTPTLKKLTAEERTHLRNIGACFRCRKTGHLSRECPSKPTTSTHGSSSTSGSSKNSNHQ
jgi:Ty3 transposon capsid-like protein/Zinc knuckle